MTEKKLPQGVRQFRGTRVIWIPRRNLRLEAILDSLYMRIGVTRWLLPDPSDQPEPSPSDLAQQNDRESGG